MRRLLIDSDVLIDVLRGAQIAVIEDDDDVAISVVTRCELFSGRHVDDEPLRVQLRDFHEVHVDGGIAERAGRLRRRSGLRTPDALIAATALITDRQLLTRNRRDFGPVDGLLFAELDADQ